MIQSRLKDVIFGALREIYAEHSAHFRDREQITLEHPADITHGDYSTNVALVFAKKLKLSPRAIAESIVTHIETILADRKLREKHDLESVASVDIAGPGFINIHLKRDFFADQVVHILKEGKNFGTNSQLKGKKIVIDYTDPNPFKVFHIGHLMANAVGEALSRVIEAHGADVVRVSYQGDVGLHVAKAVWGMVQDEAHFPKEDATLTDMINYISESYVMGSTAYDKPEEVEKAKLEINHINKLIFDRSNPKLMKIYNWGRKVSLLNFEVIYKKLGTRFDHYFFESEVADDGIAIVRDFLKRGIFAESEGAIIFKGEEYGLHTRVFITSAGLPTYETKEIGLTRIKFDKWNPDMSIVVTANEQSDYFRVLLKALSLMFPYMAPRMRHVSHGMLRFSSGKMSSRKGNVITGESLLADVAVLAGEKMSDRDFGGVEEKAAAARTQAITDISVGAIKYSILKQAPGGDIIYDFEKSISFEGDSGPYLQYACVRARSLVAKAAGFAVDFDADFSVAGKKDGKSTKGTIPPEATYLEKILYRYPEVVERAGQTYEPHHIVTYLIELSAAFNNFYANATIIDATDPFAPYRVALTQSFATVLENGLTMLGIRVPEKM